MARGIIIVGLALCGRPPECSWNLFANVASRDCLCCASATALVGNALVEEAAPPSTIRVGKPSQGAPRGLNSAAASSKVALRSLWKPFAEKDCGGSAIVLWTVADQNAELSHYGEGGYEFNVQDCKDRCRVHLECAAFVFLASNNTCSFWRAAPLVLKGWIGRTCYVKRGVDVIVNGNLESTATTAPTSQPTSRPTTKEPTPEPSPPTAGPTLNPNDWRVQLKLDAETEAEKLEEEAEEEVAAEKVGEVNHAEKDTAGDPKEESRNGHQRSHEEATGRSQEKESADGETRPVEEESLTKGGDMEVHTSDAETSTSTSQAPSTTRAPQLEEASTSEASPPHAASTTGVVTAAASSSAADIDMTTIASTATAEIRTTTMASTTSVASTTSMASTTTMASTTLQAGMTSLTREAGAGDTVLHVASTMGFAAGDVIMIGDERNSVVGFGSVLLRTPLLHAWPFGTTIKRLETFTTAAPRDAAKQQRPLVAVVQADTCSIEEVQQSARLRGVGVENWLALQRSNLNSEVECTVECETIGGCWCAEWLPASKNCNVLVNCTKALLLEAISVVADSCRVNADRAEANGFQPFGLAAPWLLFVAVLLALASLLAILGVGAAYLCRGNQGNRALAVTQETDGREASYLPIGDRNRAGCVEEASEDTLRNSAMFELHEGESEPPPRTRTATCCWCCWPRAALSKEQSDHYETALAFRENTGGEPPPGANLDGLEEALQRLALLRSAQVVPHENREVTKQDQRAVVPAQEFSGLESRPDRERSARGRRERRDHRDRKGTNADGARSRYHEADDKNVRRGQIGTRERIVGDNEHPQPQPRRRDGGRDRERR